MKPKYMTYPSSDSELDVDTGFKDYVRFDIEGYNTDLDQQQIKVLVEQLSTWLGYMVMENA